MSAVIASDSVAFKLTGVAYTPPGGSSQNYIPLNVKSYSLTLDKAQSPYVDATIVVTTPEIGAVALMDPTSLTLRGYLTLTKTGVRPSVAEVTRNFDLMVRSVKNDAASGETTIGLSSDEGYLIIDRYAAASVDTTYEAYQASLRTLVAAVLESYGDVLYPDVARNLIQNPIPSSTTGYTAAAGALTYASSVMTLTSDGTAAGDVFNSTRILLQGTSNVAASVTVKNPGSSAIGYRVRVAFYDVTNTALASSYAAGSSSYQSLAAGATVTPTVIVPVAPVGAVSCRLVVDLATTSGGTPASGTAIATSSWNLQIGASASTAFFSSASTLAGYTFRLDPDGTAVQTATGAPSSETGDADYTITATATNLVTNPKAGTAITGWLNTGTGSLARVATGGPSSPLSIPEFARFTSSASNASGLLVYQTGLAVQPSTAYKFSAWVRCSVAINVALEATVYNSSGTTLSSPSGSTIAIAANTWTKVEMTFTSDATAATVRLYCEALSTLASGVTFDHTGWLLTPTTGIHDDEYWDGTLGDTTHYALAWTGTADASTSTRTRLDARDTKVLDRTPGQAMWDWVSGLVQTPGYRLFCDEARVWRMVDNSYAVTGSIALTQAINLTQGADTIDIGQADTDGNGWVEKVVVIYQWIDRVTAANMTAYDYAGSGHGPGITITVNTPYPGPGYAAAVLARMQGRAHVLALSALSDLTATPGNDVTASLPSLAEVGKIASVTWTDADEMAVGTEGLVTIPANAWALAVGAWSAATGTWAGATGTN